MAFLEVSNISRVIQEQVLVNDINFSLPQFHKVAIAGTTGSGKTSLLQMIAGLEQPSTGTIMFKDKKVKGPLQQLLPGHAKIAYLSQHFELRNNYKISELLDMSNQLSQQEADIIYQICKIEHLLQRKNNQLSGGERQRVSLARVLVTAPELLLLDEPFSNLDTMHKTIIKQVIEDICGQLQITVMLVAHDPLDVLPWADQIFVMEAGHIIQRGAPKEIYQQPVSEYCAGLFGDYNLINVKNLPQFRKPAGNKKLFLRPEQLTISPATNFTMQDVVTQVQYFGSYYLVQVKTGTELITVRTTMSQFKPGDRVFVAAPNNEFWYL